MQRILTILLLVAAALFGLTTCEGSYVDPGALEMLGGTNGGGFPGGGGFGGGSGGGGDGDGWDGGGNTGTAPTITTTTLPDGTVGTAYSQTLAAIGTAPITWSIATGTLPGGLYLSTAGVISGTPTTANTFNFTVKATNAKGSDTKSLSITTAPIDLPSDAIALTENQWADGDIPTSGDRQQWFTFTATASTQYIHVEFGTLTQLYVQVYDNSGEAVGSETNLSSWSITRTSRTLSEGETYYIRVTPYSYYSGTYRIAFTTSIVPPPGATSLTENQWADGSIPTSDGEQWFKFTATASTQYIHVSFGTLTDLYVQVYDSSGTTVESGTHLYSFTTSTSLRLTAGQTYYIRVWSYSGSGTYRIVFNTSVVTPGYSAVTSLTVNQWTNGNIPTSDDEQWFRFTATASTQYLHVAFGTLTDLYVQVYNSSGARVGGINLYGSTTRTSVSLTVGQTYYIRVMPYNSGGTYQIGFNTSSTTTPTEPIPPEFQNAIQLTVNQWANGNLPTTNGEQCFKFTATAATQYIHFAKGTLEAVRVQVYASNGTTTVGSVAALYVADNSSRTNTSRTLIVGQTYYIKVTPDSIGISPIGTGNYQIGFSPVPIMSAISLTANTWTNGNITTSGGEQWFRFTATSIAQWIHFSTSGTLNDVYVQLYDSSGATVGSETELYGSATSTARSLDSGQTYYIRVRPYSSSGSGTYRIGFNTSTTAPTS